MLAIATFILYWPVHSHQFINYDDQDYVSFNSHVQQGLTWPGVRWAFTTRFSANWHPITWLAHMMDYQLFGMNPAGHHLSNVLLHATNAVLLFLFLAHVTGFPARSFVVAGLFALHPLHVESVAWVAEKKDLLAAFFGLGALWAYCASRLLHSGTSQKGLRLYFLAIFLHAFSLMSKPMLVTLPFLLLLLDYWPLERLNTVKQEDFSKLIIEKAPFFLLSATSCWITLHVQKAAMGYYQQLSFANRFCNALLSYVSYIGKTIWPSGLAILYPRLDSVPMKMTIISVGTTLLISFVGLVVLRTKRYAAFGWCWFLGALVPVIGFVQVGVQARADRYTYLPLIGLFVWLVWSGVELFSRLHLSRALIKSGAVLLLMVCFAISHHQIRFWQDTESIFLRATALTSGNWVAHYNLALWYLRQYQEFRADQRFPEYVLPPPSERSTQPADLLEKIVFHCSAAIEARPNFPDAERTIGKALSELGRLDEAHRHIALFVAEAPADAEGHQNLAEMLARKGQKSRAVAEYQTALKLKPHWDSVLNNLAWITATDLDPGVRNGGEAVRLASRANELSGYTNLSYLHTLAAACAESGDFPAAIAHGKQALTISERLNDTNLIAKAELRLEMFQARKMVRD